MLHEFIDLNRDVIIARTRDRVRSRPWPSVAPGEVEHGVPPVPDRCLATAGAATGPALA